MTHLYIEQATDRTEEVNSSIISKLYELAISGDLDETSNLKGRLHSISGYANLVDYLNETFGPDLVISVDNKYLQLYDPILEGPFATKWGDGIGVTATLLSLANATATEIGEMLQSLPDNELTDMRDFKKVNTRSALNEFGSQFRDKTKRVVHAYIPNAYGTIRTRYTYSPFGLALTDIELCDNFTSFGDYALTDCSNLIMSELPDSVTYIGRHAFNGCSKITINNSKNVTQIMGNAFRNCTSITSFTIKNICEMNGVSFFNGCTNLETVIFEQGPGPDIKFEAESNWKDGAFVNTKITTLDLPERIVYFGNASMNCSTLRTLIIRKTTVPSKATWSLNDNVLIYVPDASVQLYKDAWTDEANRIHPISELPSQ